MRVLGVVAVIASACGRIDFDPAPLSFQAVSRISHTGQATPFDVELPTDGPVGIECRLGDPQLGPGTYHVAFELSAPVAFSDAAVISEPGHTARVASVSGSGTDEALVDLTDVDNVQILEIQIVAGATVIAAAHMAVVVGDATASGCVTGADVSTVQAQGREQLTIDSYRSDLNASGRIDGNDVSLAQSLVGQCLP